MSNYPRGSTHCDGPTCCIDRDRSRERGEELPRVEGDPEGERRWFCSVECRQARLGY